MHKYPIGVFDSGFGGLSVLDALQKKLPKEDFVYIADQAFAPYGKRSAEQIMERSHTMSRWLLAKGCKLIIVACNTATTNAIQELRATYTIPFVGIEPAIKPAALGSTTAAIGVLATEGTLSSALFHSTTQDHAKNVRVITQVGHGLVELVEKGLADSQQADTLLKEALAPILVHPIDHLVLGCTHYPFLTTALKRILPSSVQIVDCSAAIARQTERLLEKHELKNQVGGNAHFFTTAPTESSLWKTFGVDLISQVEI
ncbi:MAG: glutamate racemase [Flavobacteriaceae bacterium]